jgi:hypothetical protein
VLSVISPKKAHPAADRQGARDKVSKDIKMARGSLIFLSHIWPEGFPSIDFAKQISNFHN